MKKEDKDSDSGLRLIWSNVSSKLVEVGQYLRVTRATRIIRRYFAMNAFDGAMTSLGVVIGAYLSNISDPSAIVGVIVVGGFAMAVSGFSGTYMTESAERSHSLNELEDAMLVDLDHTIYGHASRFVSIFAAIVDGSAPFLASIPAIIPFLIANMGYIGYQLAYNLSIGLTLLTLFILGVFLGKISKKNIYYSGIKMTLAGIAVALIALVLNHH